MTNQQWIASGKTGCTFATLFAKAPQTVGWEFVSVIEYTENPKRDSLLVFILFEDPNWNMEKVRMWALSMGFYEESTGEETLGLRIDCPEGKAWVQYFGPDSHVPTRRAPTPMLMYTNKLAKSYYVKVGFKGVLHLAHAFYDKISERVYDLLWDRSYAQTYKKLGHKPGIKEAAKTTWLKNKRL